MMKIIMLSFVFLVGACETVSTNAVPNDVAVRISISSKNVSDERMLTIVSAQSSDQGDRNIKLDVLKDLALLTAAERSVESGFDKFTVFQTKTVNQIRNTAKGSGDFSITRIAELIEYSYGSVAGDDATVLPASDTVDSVRKSLAEKEYYEPASIQ
jgi:hypothetical protein